MRPGIWAMLEGTPRLGYWSRHWHEAKASAPMIFIGDLP